MLANLNAAADGNDAGHMERMDEEDDDSQTEEWVRRQKAEIKELQKKIELSKKEYKQSQAEVESLRLQDPILYRKKDQVLQKVKAQLDNKIDKMNQRVAKVREIEAKLR